MNLTQQLKQDPMEFKRQSGRTTRMMEAAKAVARTGKAVVVVFKDERDAGYWRVKYANVAGMSVIPMKVKMPELDWSQLKIVSGPYANHQTFLDHDTIFAYNKDVLKAWHQYDLPVTGEPYKVLADA
jgi:hypothetical protein